MHLPPIRSKQEDVTPGGTTEFEGFVPPRMGRGGRAVIKGFWIRVFGTITVADELWDGRDVPRIINHVAVETRAGTRRHSLSGFKSRMAAILFCGIEKHIEHANVAIGAAQAVDLWLYIPMAKPKLPRGDDYALPADVFEKIVITWASLAGAATDTTTLSADSLDCYILPDLREENAVEVKAEDQVTSLNFGSQTQITKKLGGALHDAFITRENTTGGGGLVTAITDVRCDELGIPPTNRVDLVRWYTFRRGISPTGATAIAAERFADPFRDGQALAVILADDDTSPWAGKVVSEAKFDLGAGAADLSLVTREVLPKSQANFNAQAAQFGIDPNRMRMKTLGKTKRGMDKWSKRARAVGVWSAPLPNVEGNE